MADRTELIAQKQAVRRQIERARRRLEQAHQQHDGCNNRQIRRWENELEHLMAKEYNLRLAIDRSRR